MKAIGIIIALLIFYVGSYAGFYVNARPAANLAYFVYLKGGVEVEGREKVLYYFYYPAYKVHRLFGVGRHNYDRPNVDGEGLYDGDEPNK
jgi:hypothetical protein